jgi:hypothetical protein
LNSPLILMAGAVGGVAVALRQWPGIWATIREAAEGALDFINTRFGDIVSTFGDVGQTMRDTWQSVVTAVSSGDLGAAFDVAAAGLKLSWAQTAGGLADRWYTVVDAITDYWTDATHGIAAMAAQAVHGVENLFLMMKDAALNAFAMISKPFQMLINEFKFGYRFITEEEKHARNKQLDVDRKRASAQRRLSMAERGVEQEAYIQQLAKMAEEEKQARRQGRGANVAAAEAQLQEAQERFREVQRQIAEAAKTPKKADDALGGAAADAKSSASGLAGMFNAMMAGQQLGLKEVQERTARASERTARGVDKLVDAAREGGGLQVG